MRGFLFNNVFSPFNWKLSLFALLMIPLAGGLAKNLGKKIGKATTQAGEISGNLTSFLSDIF